MSAPTIRTRTAARLAAAVALVVSAFALPAATSNANAPTGPGHVRALFFGDSLMNGTGARPTRPVMARVAARQLGWEITVNAFGGTGYTTRGARGKPSLDRLSRPGVLTTPYDVVLIEGGTNDKAADPATMRARTAET